MKPLPIDPCLWYRNDYHTLTSILAIQVDDNLFGGTPQFMKLESVSSNKFRNSGQTKLSWKRSRFNGLDIRTVSGCMIIDQRYYIEGLTENPNNRYMSFDEFRSVRQKLAYTAYSSMPGILVYCAKLAQYTNTLFVNSSYEPLRLLRKTFKIMKHGPSLYGIKHNTFSPDAMEVVVCVDAAFATKHDKTSQIGILAMSRDKERKVLNAIHYASSKSKRFVRNALAAELLAMVDGFDVGFSIRDSVQRMLGSNIVDLTMISDSRSLFGLLVSLAHTTQLRFQIDLEMLRETYKNREISNAVWISGGENPADDLTKADKRDNMLAKLIQTGRFETNQCSWIHRDSLTLTSSNQAVN